MRIINITRSTVLAENAKTAKSFFSRIKGLLGKKTLTDKEALIIADCRSIHTCFMQFPIDVLFVSKDNKIIAIKKAVPPFRFTPLYFRARFVIELPANTIDITGAQLNDIIKIES